MKNITEEENSMLLGARTQMMDGKYTFEEIFAFSKECGVEALEYCCEDFGFQYRPETTEDYTIEHVKELSEKYNIKIGAVGNHLAFAQKELYFEAIKKMIPKVKRLGTDVFIISSNPIFGGNSNIKILQPEMLDVYKKKLRALLDVAEENGVKLALEPEPPGFITSSQDMLNLIDEMKSEALCINFDIGHAFLTDDDYLQTIRDFGDRIVHGHIENLIRGEHIHRLLNDGDIDLVACLTELKKLNFKGSMALDIYAFEYDKVLKESMDILREMYAKA